MPVVNPGIRRQVAGAITRLFNSAAFALPLTHTAVPTRGSITPTFTRATTSTWTNNDGYMVTGVAGEIGFVGARRVRNAVVGSSEDFSNAAWTKSTMSATVAAVDPPAGCSIVTKLYPTGSGNDSTVRLLQNITVIAGNYYIGSIYLKYSGFRWIMVSNVDSNASNDKCWFDVLNGVAGTSGVGTISFTFEDVGNGWYRINTRSIAATTNGYTYISCVDGDASSTVTASGTNGVYLTGAMIEDVTAQTTQTAGEYVSVGALDYRSELNRLYLSLPGTAGHYASTPDSAAASVTGDIALVFKGALADWTPAAASMLGSKWIETGNQRSYGMYINIDGRPRFLWSSDGTAGTALDKSATAATSFTDGVVGYLAATLDVDNGAGGNDLKFWTSSDGATWSQLGSTVTTAGTTSIFNGTAGVEIGSYLSGTGLLLNGKPAEVDIYNGIPPMLGGSGSATPVVDFNPHRDAVTPTGTITSSTTGEVWTINGASSVVRSDYYHGSFVDGVKCFPTDFSGTPIAASTLLGYSAEGARTNLCLQSNAFTTTWTNSLGAITQNVVGPDGATSAWTLTDNSAVSIQTAQQSIALTAAAYTMSAFVKKTSGATTFPCYLVIAGTVCAAVTIDTNNGIATVWTAYTGNTMLAGASARCTSYNSDFWRVELTYIATATSYIHYLIPAGTTNSTQSTGVLDATAQGSAVFYGAQVELGSFASSYIATTTAAVTRDVDVLTYSSGDVPNLKTLATIGFRREVGVNSVGYHYTLRDMTTTNYIEAPFLDATQYRMDGGPGPWLAISTYTPGTTISAAQSWATNDIKMSFNGATVTPDTSAVAPVGMTHLEVGHFNSVLAFTGNVGGIYGWTRNLSQSELNAVTA